MSSAQIAQDDDGFEIASLRDSLDIDSDVEAAADGSKSPSTAPPAYDPPRAGRANRDASPLPAPVPQKPMPLPRESLDGETIFALEDEEGEKGSESDDDDDGERERLTKGV